MAKYQRETTQYPGVFWLTIQGISEVFRAIICIRTGHWPARLSADAEETEKVLMRTSQKDGKADVI